MTDWSHCIFRRRLALWRPCHCVRSIGGFRSSLSSFGTSSQPKLTILVSSNSQALIRGVSSLLSHLHSRSASRGRGTSFEEGSLTTSTERHNPVVVTIELSTIQSTDFASASAPEDGCCKNMANHELNRPAQNRFQSFRGAINGEKDAGSDVESGVESVREEDRMRSPIRRSRSQRSDWSVDSEPDVRRGERIRWQSMPDVRREMARDTHGENEFQKQI